jgi:hypothetical protein
MNNIEITEEIVLKINNLIKRFDGIDNTVTITGISKSSLKKYIEKKTKIISENVWREKLSPYFEENIFDAISKRIILLQEESKEYQDAFMEGLNTKYDDINKLKVSTYDKTIVKEIINNPILSFDEYEFDPYYDLNDFCDTIRELKKDANYSKYKLLYKMIDFGNIYEKFRPNTITNSDSYFGTVKLIDDLFFVLFSYIGSERLFSFSKVNITYIRSEKDIYTHEKINWDLLISDVEKIVDAIKMKIEEDAIKLFCILKEDSPYFCKSIISSLILRKIKNIKRELIKIDYNENVIIIDGNKIHIDNCYNIIDEIYKLSQEQS